jgi:hypothetical protein
MNTNTFFENRQQFAQALNNYMQTEGYTKVSFANKIKTSRPTLDKLLNNEFSSKKSYNSNVSKILQTLDITAEELLLYNNRFDNSTSFSDIPRKLPIGIQSFEKIISGNFIYVDKTAYIYKLVHSGIPYFLSRPRRFGKSLLISTLKSYWEGKKDLFRGLAIEQLESQNSDAWFSYPVFHFDFSRDGYKNENALEEVLDAYLDEWENIYGCEDDTKSLAIRFQNVIKRAVSQSGKKCVVLIDEYDKPLLDVFDNKDLVEHNRDVFKSFFSCLKSFDDYLQFIFITGVTKFNKVSIFSDLNQLDDITFDNAYAGLCGITDEELRKNFMPEIESLALSKKLHTKECLSKLKDAYDGYCFTSDMIGIYNPYSLLKSFSKKQFGSYWFETGTPTFLLKRVKELNFDVKSFNDGSIYITEKSISDYRANDDNPVPLLYQTGYLTILDYNEQKESYKIGFPNSEVRYGFFENLIAEYADGVGAGSGKDILSIDQSIENGDVERFMDAITALFASIPYTTKDVVFEHYFQTILYMLFIMLGKYVVCELHTFNGRIDCIVETPKYIYIFEFKRDSSADEALKQIEDMKYALAYSADKRTLFKIGINFDSKTKMPVEWKKIDG